MFLVTFNLFFPLTLICYFYGNIVKAVVAHEKALRAQAKKMNVESLRSNVVSVIPSDPMKHFIIAQCSRIQMQRAPR